MKRHVRCLIAMPALCLWACSSNDLVEDITPSPIPTTPKEEVSQDVPMAFSLYVGNMGRAEATGLQELAGNFGVWAYTGGNEYSNNTLVMGNYLVGFNGNWKLNTVSQPGYYDLFTTQYDAVTGEAVASDSWIYAFLGTEQYSSVTTNNDPAVPSTGWIQPSQTAYMSNNASQFLKYWDNNTNNTKFYAYAPYINGSETPDFDKVTKVMTFKSEFDGSSPLFYAYTNVRNAAYGQNVSMVFSRLTCELKLKFYEDITGYMIRLTQVKKIEDDGSISTEPYDEAGKYVVAVPVTETIDGDKAKYEKATAANGYVISGIPTIAFPADDSMKAPAISWSSASGPSPNTTNDNLYFNTTVQTTPMTIKGTIYNDFIGETQASATLSETVLYPVPHGSHKNCGFLFYVSYELVAVDTGEKIQVDNVPVYVEPKFTVWEANSSYTYIFKITDQGQGGNDPDNPGSSTDPTLQPIVFDGCTVKSYEDNSEEWIINRPASSGSES